MREKLNEFRPDTCRCYIQLHRDLDIPDSRNEMKHFLKKCPTHAQMSDADAWHDVWLGPSSEQHRKNGLYKALVFDDPTGLGAGLVEPRVAQQRVHSEFFGRDVGVFDAAGQAVMETTYELIGGLECYLWKFDADRCLCLCFDGCYLDAATKARLQAYCDTAYGALTVRVLNANEEA